MPVIRSKPRLRHHTATIQQLRSHQLVRRTRLSTNRPERPSVRYRKRRIGRRGKRRILRGERGGQKTNAGRSKQGLALHRFRPPAHFMRLLRGCIILHSGGGWFRRSQQKLQRRNSERLTLLNSSRLIPPSAARNFLERMYSMDIPLKLSTCRPPAVESARVEKGKPFAVTSLKLLWTTPKPSTSGMQNATASKQPHEVCGWSK